jgi:signal peptidase I
VRKFLKGLAWVVGTLAVLAIVARLTFIRVWTVPDDRALSASLAPSLASGDIVLVLYRGERSIGDLVRCPDPEDAQRWVVGRIVGQQGDKVEVQNGLLILNGKRYEVSEACAEPRLTVPHPTDGRPVDHACMRVELGGGWHAEARALTASPDSPREHTVGPGRVYLLSDNRTYHDDSRDFGAIPADSCKEQIVFRLWGKDGFFADKHRFAAIH